MVILYFFTIDNLIINFNPTLTSAWVADSYQRNLLFKDRQKQIIMGILSTIQSAANVRSSKTYVTSQVFKEDDIKTLRDEMKNSKNGKYSRTIGCFVEEKACTLEKAKSYSFKASINKMKGTKTFTLFCNPDEVKKVLKEHETAVEVESINAAIQKAAMDV